MQNTREFLTKLRISDISSRLSANKLSIIEKELGSPDLPDNIRREVHEKLASVYEAKEDWISAMHHYNDSGNMKKKNEMYYLLGR